MSFRRLRRAVALVSSLLIVSVRYWLIRARGPLTPKQRVEWQQASSRLILASLGIHFQVHGEPPSRGLVVSNHLSYLDVLIIAAAMPNFSVAKIEIESWPFFGWATRQCGTIFLDRSSRESARKVAAEIGERLKLPIPVLLFPEGTSSDGSTVLPFHPRLIDPATAAGAPVTAAAVRYVIEGGVEERALCWFGDTGFLPHLLKALGTPGFSAEVMFGEPKIYPDRRTAADATHAEVSELRAGVHSAAPQVELQEA